jgi:GntP family gluconate:H+ symporter
VTHPSDVALMTEATGCIAVAVLLIMRLRFHPFLALTCAALILAMMASPDPLSGIGSIEKGFGAVIGGVGLVIALGLTLGAILTLSGAASALAARFVDGLSERYQPWGVLFAALVIGLPLCFETGVVVLLPIVGAIAATGAVDGRGAGRRRLVLALSALAGLSVLHALVPPHPGPLAAAHELGASLGRTLFYGVMVAIPSAVVAGPVFARLAARWTYAEPLAEPAARSPHPPSARLALLVVLLPVALIGVAELARSWPLGSTLQSVLAVLGAPAVALLVTNLFALATLVGPQAAHAHISREAIWTSALAPAGSILLSIGAGGAFKQVLIDVGLAPALLRLLDGQVTSPIVLGWLMAAAVRLATGSATVATVTAAGLMAAMPSAPSVRPEWIVLAIGAGSIFFSYVNDPGFWLVKGFLGTSTGGTTASWSVLETLLSVTALLAILVSSRIFP